MAKTSSNHNGGFQLEFEKPLIQLEKQIAELERSANEETHGYSQEIQKLRESHAALLTRTYSRLTRWQTVQVARHPHRPQAIDYIRSFVKDFCELHGDRRFGDDKAIITGFGRVGPHKCLFVAHHKGRDTKEKIAANFGCAHPEGYRKALAKMQLAEKFELPIVTLIDTAGAYPGVGSEERGVAEAIATNLREMSRLRTPIACAVIGEGGSGGALGIGVGDRIGMMKYAWYSVISPENCSAILWRDGEHTAEAAEQLHLTARDNQELGIVDDVIDEPLGGAHRDPETASNHLEQWITKTVRDLKRYKMDNLLRRRYDKFRKMGRFINAA